MSDWRLIETVPAQAIVLLTDGEIQVTGVTDDDRQWFHLIEPGWPWLGTATEDWHPTHWLPLPEPPRAREDDLKDMQKISSGS
jgi:hypothetical protein